MITDEQTSKSKGKLIEFPAKAKKEKEGNTVPLRAALKTLAANLAEDVEELNSSHCTAADRFRISRNLAACSEWLERVADR